MGQQWCLKQQERRPKPETLKTAGCSSCRRHYLWVEADGSDFYMKRCLPAGGGATGDCGRAQTGHLE